MQKRYEDLSFGDYKNIIFEADERIEYIFDELEGGKLIVRAVIKQNDRILDEKLFKKMTSEERKIIKEWIEYLNPETPSQKEFIKYLKMALEEINYDYWISTKVPSMINGKIEFVEDIMNLRICLPIKEWEKMYTEYAPNMNSRIATVFEVLLWYAWSMATNYSKPGHRKSYKNLYHIAIADFSGIYHSLHGYINWYDYSCVLGNMLQLFAPSTPRHNGYPVMVCTEN